MTQANDANFPEIFAMMLFLFVMYNINLGMKSNWKFKNLSIDSDIFLLYLNRL